VIYNCALLGCNKNIIFAIRFTPTVATVIIIKIRVKISLSRSQRHIGGVEV